MRSKIYLLNPRVPTRQTRARAKRLAITTGLCLGGLSLLLIAPLPARQGPAFNVASVRQNISGSTETSVNALPGRFIATNTSLTMLIGYAYDLTPSLAKYLLVGGSQDILSARFDVTGTTPEQVSPDRLRLMLRALLAERFGLRLRTEVRQVPIYALTVATDDELGPDLRPSAHNCQEFRAARRAGADVTDPVDERGRSVCLGGWDFGSGTDPALRVKSAGELSDLLSQIQAFIDRPVEDRTGLSGNFEWMLRFRITPMPIPGSDAPTILVAFSEQLGLRLVPEQAAMDVFVIDSVNMPIPN